MVKNQGAQTAGMSQAGGRGQEKRPAISPRFVSTERSKAKRPPWEKKTFQH
ncbi:hypothetical protein P9B45_14445 [Bacillus paralicheniformis]|nr:hypothetical protein [Bacillus paralicheniformis]MEC1282521.1 hypothetical protein [Bacillus paralicheniformis]